MNAPKGSLRALVLAEWTKARTVRSTWWSLLATAALCVGPGVLIGTQFTGPDAPEGRTDPVVTQLSFYPLLIGQIALVVFGVLLAGAEYTTGTIHASLAAAPRRGRFFAAKTVVVAAVAAVTAVAVTFAAFFATRW